MSFSQRSRIKSDLWGDRPPSRNSRQGVGSGQRETAELRTGTPEWKETEGSSSIAEKRETTLIKIGGINDGPVVFVGDGDYIVGGDGNMMRRWRVKDGREVRQPMDAGSLVRSIAVSRDGRWIVSGTKGGQVTVWNAESHEKVIEFTGHSGAVYAVDISPDTTSIATGSSDWTASVWSRSTGERLLGPFKHGWSVGAVHFSPDGRFMAIATRDERFVGIYDSHDGRLLVDAPIQASSSPNNTLAWASDSRQLFVLSHDASIHCLEVATGQVRSTRAIHSNGNPRCLALASNGAFIAVASSSSVSFWDTATQKQVGSLVHHPTRVRFIAISAKHDLVISGGAKAILWKLADILPSSYLDHKIGVFRTLAEGRSEETMTWLRTQRQRSNDKITHLEQNIQALRNEAREREIGLNETISSLRIQNSTSNETIAHLKRTNQELRNESRKREDGQSKTISSLHARNSKSIAMIANLERTIQALETKARQREDSLIEIISSLHVRNSKSRVQTARSR